MRALVFHGVGRLAVEAVPEPAAGPGEVVVAIRATGVCGSDVHGYAGRSERRVPDMVMGHEAVGVVRAHGPDVDGPPTGTPVAVNPAVTCGACAACRTPGMDNLCEQRRLYGCVRELPGAFAEALVVRAENAVPLAGPAPLEWGALVEPFAVGDHGAALLGDPPPERVLIVGGGPIGIGAALAARRRGAGHVVVSEPGAHRRAVAAALGLETVDPAAAPPGAGERYDAAVECVAAPATLRAALGAVVPRGTVVLVGLGAPELPLPVGPVVVGERILRGSFNYTRESFADVAAWVMSGQVDLAPVIEARVALEDLPGVFAAYADGRREDVKTVFRPEHRSER